LRKILQDIVGINERNTARAGYVWNTIAGLINASESVILLIVITRISGIEEAGIVSIAFTISNLFLSIGKFGMRNYQVTDISKKYTFVDYRASRIITTISMIAVCVLYLLHRVIVGDYTLYKAFTVLFICGLYTVEAYEDIYVGLYQRNGRLDVGMRIFSIRWIIALVILIIILMLSHNIVIASLISLLFSLIVFSVLNNTVIQANELKCEVHRDNNFKRSFNLLKSCTNLFIISFLSYYITSAPKYAIDKYMTDEVQACYGFVAMPVFVIGLLNSFIYQPQMVHMSIEWKNNEMVQFITRIWRQIIIILLITIVCLIGAFVVGIPVLSLLYGINLQEYKPELLILLCSGGGLAIVGFLMVILIIMREQKALVVGYIITATLAFTLSGIVVKKYGTLGASIFSFVLSLVLSLILGGFIVYYMKEKKQGLTSSILSVIVN